MEIVSETITHQVHDLYSKYLCYHKKVEIFLPPQYDTEQRDCALLVINDGQDSDALRIGNALEALSRQQEIVPLIIVAVHANNRLHEYGTARRPDYKNRGSRAEAYTKFVVKELMPFLYKHYRISRRPADCAFAGCSLGGLSAFDIVWHNPRLFATVGVFSGALWWRRHSRNDHFADSDRIIHAIVRDSEKRDGLRFWFEAGTDDEKDDRNNNGIIDAIDDTLDLMAELVLKGYDNARDICYVEVQGGQHNQATWAKVLPDFLRWAFKH
jgi:enterochelin esterase-like enzyme